MNSTIKQRAVAVTGMGIISAAGNGISAFKEALLYGRNYFTSLPYPPLAFPIIGAFINSFSFPEALSRYSALSPERHQKIEKITRHLSYSPQIAFIAAMEAWQQAAFDRSMGDATRTSLIVAMQNTTSRYQYDLIAEFQREPTYLSPTYALHSMDTDYIGVLSEAFGILGEGFTVGGASASGNMALLRAYQLIRDDWMDASLVVGALADLSPLEFQGFYNIGAMGGQRYADEPQKACRPFDKNHEGFIYGQAAASLFLESISSAEKRNAPILGYIIGGASVLDGTHSSSPNSKGELHAMQKALQIAGITANDIDYINTHGTSSPLGDETELQAIETLLGKRSHGVPINSTKSIAGHCLWSAGLVEAIATLLQMQENFVHPTLNLEQPISKKCHFVTNESESFGIRLALSNSFGFGGINTSLVFSRNTL